MLGTEAETSTDISVAETSAEVTALGTQANLKKVRKAAGGGDA